MTPEAAQKLIANLQYIEKALQEAKTALAQMDKELTAAKLKIEELEQQVAYNRQNPLYPPSPFKEVQP